MYDYIIVGSGIAGLFTALLAQQHGKVMLLTKGTLEECNTQFAQGGIAAPVGPLDDPELHLQDTLVAGAGLCDVEMVRVLTSEAVDRIRDLIAYGVPFDTIDGEISLGREGAHSIPRVLHAGGDATGANIENTLSHQARSSGIDILEHCLLTEVVVDDGIAVGVRVSDITGGVVEYQASHVILATGGAGNLFRSNTNPSVATGDGVAVAFRAGAEIIDIEFFQFHPTALSLPGAPSFLISEAARGEGGILRDINGRRFAFDYHPQGELGPRDVVARAILSEMQRDNTEYVYLDLTHLPSALVTARFPSIYQFCLSYGLDITRQQIPVAPAAHYMIGGIRTGLWGETNITGLYACGEAACTGVHGANRLASNSLLEGLVFGCRIVERTLRPPVALPASAGAVLLPEREPGPGAPAASLAALQALMWDEVGMIRSRESLEWALGTLASWPLRINAGDRSHLEMCNMTVVGRLMAEAALLREESRGAHFRSDYAHSADQWKRHIIFRASPESMRT
jgi:L-aspartate oxidase